jgi:hypothetical protein
MSLMKRAKSALHWSGFETAGSLNSQAGKTKTLGRKEKKATKNDATKGLKVPLVYRLSVRFSMKTTRSQI